MNLNILTLGIVYKGTAIPVYWLVLNNRGNSNQRERIALLKRFIHQFGRDTILGVLGDREFIGEWWWKWLTAEQIPYLIRMKENQLMTNRTGQKQPVWYAFRSLKAGHSRCLHKARRVGQQRVFLSGMRLDSGKGLILASNRRFRNPLEIYALRWDSVHDNFLYLTNRC